MKKTPWNRIPWLTDFWRTLPKSRCRIFEGQMQVLIYTKEQGTHWADLFGLSNAQIRILEERQ